MSKSGFTKLRDDFIDAKIAAIDLNSIVRSWAARKGYPMYQAAVKRRWITQNASEGSTWKAVKASTEARKISLRKRNPDQYPGGKKVLVLTGALFKSVSGQEKTHHRAMFTNQGFSVSTTIPYAKYVNEARPFVGFGAQTNFKISNSLRDVIKAVFKRKNSLNSKKSEAK